MSNICGFIALSAMGMRGQVGSVGLDQKAVQWKGGNGLPSAICILIRYRARDTDLKAHVDRTASVGQAA